MNYRRDDESPSDYADRLERAEIRAGRWFDSATRPQLARYRERMAVAAPYKGAPKWERFRDAAEREFKRTTAAAAELSDLTLVELLTAGEVSEELCERWDRLEAVVQQEVA